MNSLYDLLLHIRRAFGIPDARRPEVESLTDEKFRARVRGGWLFDLVIGAAAQYYGIKREDYILDEDIVQDVELRIKGLARVVARETEDTGKIAALARKELDHRIRRGYLARMAMNVWRDLRKKETRDQKRQADPADADKNLHADWERKQHRPEDPIPDVERDERLRLIFGPEAASPAHEMLAFAWCPPRFGADRSTTGRTPQAMVEDLATLTLSQLADSWVQCFAQIERRDPADVESLFKGMTDKANSTRLFEFWDPRDAIEAWVESVQTEIAGEGCIRTIPLHMRAAYLYSRKLGYTTERIAAQMGVRRLDQLTADFATEYAARVHQTADEVRSEFEPFLAYTGKATDPLSKSYKPHRKVVHWTQNVSRRARAAEFKQLKGGLQLIVSGRIEPWKVMAFLHCHCLSKTPHLIAKKYRSQPLQSMKDGLIRDFAERWDTIQDYVHASLRTLGRKLIKPDTPRTLEACAGKDSDLVEELQAWSEEVLTAVGPEFARAPGLRLFALRHRLPPGTGTAQGAAA
jgi:DNA-directed RNA polymerase specialized sigma24 family protein